MSTSQVTLADAGPNFIGYFHGMARHPLTGAIYVVIWYRDSTTVVLTNPLRVHVR